jgi:hypothetical protein
MTACVQRRELLLGLAALPVASRLAAAETYPGSPQDYGRTIAADTDKWGKVVQFSGAHVD